MAIIEKRILFYKGIYDVERELSHRLDREAAEIIA